MLLNFARWLISFGISFLVSNVFGWTGQGIAFLCINVFLHFLQIAYRKIRIAKSIVEGPWNADGKIIFTQELYFVTKKNIFWLIMSVVLSYLVNKIFGEDFYVAY